jgi:hypothetical protein
MADISDAVDPIAAAIYEQYEKRNETEQPRSYLGGSAIGMECKRALWYTFRFAGREQFDGRMLRLFETGHLAEARFVENLRSIGCEVWECDPATGKQFSYKDISGHMAGNLDAVARHLPLGGALPHLVEMKTHSAKSFKELKAKGVKVAKPQHYAQMIMYAGWAKLPRMLYIAVNKDTDELYTERLEFDPVEFEKLRAKAESIIFAAEPPPKLSEDPKFYLCNWCSHNAVCHGNKVPAASCRTCVHSTPERNGDARWSCAKHASDPNINSIPIEVQRTGCDHHLTLPYLVTFAEPTDAGDGWIAFKRKDTGAEFVMTDAHRSPPGDLPVTVPIFSSREIASAKDHRSICDRGVEKLRTEFNGTIIS